MSVKIRLTRAGAKNRDFWRVVVSDAKMPRDGRFIEEIGFYDPIPKQDKLEIRQERLEYWLSQGAQPSPTVRSLLKRHKTKA